MSRFNPLEWMDAPVKSKAPVRNHHPHPLNSDDEIEIITRRIEAAALDLSCNYRDWLIIGFALADEMGEGGRSYFHRLSRFHPDYQQAACDRQYDRCLKGNKRGITIRSFYYLAQSAGVDIKVRKNATQ